MTSLPFAVRSSTGVRVQLGFGNDSHLKVIESGQSKSCRTIIFSPDGKYFAYACGQTLKILDTGSWKDLAVVNTKAYHVAFSPKGTYLMSWEPFTVSNSNPQGSPNLNIYRSENGELVKNFIHKKQGNWEPQWSSDEKLFTRLVNKDVVFYEDLNFEKIVTRLNSFKIASYKLSPNIGTYFLVCHTLGSPGQPSFGRVFKYPNFEAVQTIANRSFFQADYVEFYWNLKGNNALLLTSTEVDQSGGSYYGKQGLYFIGLNGQTTIITLSKEGPIYNVAWSPKNHEFCVVYGFMPAKATLFNLKCEPVFELGTGPKNAIHYNPYGNIVLLGGFGNLRGQIEIWDAINKKQIGSCEAPDTTLLQWAADGEHFLTATTAPRLRVGNGYKIWHYSGALLYERHSPEKEELYDVRWKNFPKRSFPEPTLTDRKVQGIAPSQPQASVEVYRPPSARNRPFVKFSLNEDDDKPVSANAPSKASLKNKKKREAKKAKKLEEGIIEEKAPSVTSSVTVNVTGDPELDKKLKNIKKKLDAIEKLKQQQAQGKTLEINQLAKIQGEAALLQELKKLTV